MNLTTSLRTLMIDIGHIVEHYRKISKITGEEFNIFNIMGLRSSEVRLHSAILTDLLNPEGSHGQSDLFLKLFLKQYGITDFSSEHAIAECEKSIGVINPENTQGGRIDILITDNTKRHIMIENKIYAEDQQNQLLRYFNYDPDGHLFYLTLSGTSPSSDSTGSQLTENDYICISYGYEIIRWLEMCKKEAASLPVIRETITQYISLLKQLTNQSTNEKMKDQIKEVLRNNPDYLKIIEVCSEVIQSTMKETKGQFQDLFNTLYPEKIHSDDGIDIWVRWGEDGDGIFFGYQALRGEKNVSNSDIVKRYVQIFKEMECGMYFGQIHFAWFCPEITVRYRRFDRIPKEEIFKMNSNHEYLKGFVEQLIKEENEIRAEFLKRL